MNRSLCLVSVICVFTGIIIAQEHQVSNDGMIPMLRRRALVLDINARVLESENIVIWNETHQKTTIPGSPVSIQMVGANLAVSLQFTPFLRRNGNVLVAQGQIWIKDSEHGISYYTSIQTIPMEFDEPIYFFPLGQTEEPVPSSLIEIILKVNQLRENTSAETTINTNNDD